MFFPLIYFFRLQRRLKIILIISGTSTNFAVLSSSRAPYTKRHTTVSIGRIVFHSILSHYYQQIRYFGTDMSEHIFLDSSIVSG